MDNHQIIHLTQDELEHLASLSGRSVPKIKKTVQGVTWQEFCNKMQAARSAIDVTKDTLDCWRVMKEYVKVHLNSKKDNGCDSVTEVEDVSLSLDMLVAKKMVAIYNSAKRRGLDFNMTIKYTKKELMRKKCPYLGIPLQDNVDALSPNKRTFDRIDNSKGYIDGNVIAVSHKANQMKNILLEDDTSGYKVSYTTLERFVNNLKKRGVK